MLCNLSFLFCYVFCLAVLPSVVFGKGMVAVLAKLTPVSIERMKLRNQKLYEHIYKPAKEKIDIVIFCDYCPPPDALEVLNQYEDMPLQYVRYNLTGIYDLSRLNSPKKGGKPNPICPYHGGFTYGYKFMCTFWFIEFVKYTTSYDWLLRIDDDVYVENNISIGFNPSIQVAASSWSTEDIPLTSVATTGLMDFTRDFLRNKGLYTSPNPLDDQNQLISPYTNVMYLNLDWVRKTPLLMEYMKAVHDSYCIMFNRWGDLQLWGLAVTFLNLTRYSLLLEYNHGSHHCIAGNKYMSKHPKKRYCTKDIDVSTVVAEF